MPSWVPIGRWWSASPPGMAKLPVRHPRICARTSSSVSQPSIGGKGAIASQHPAGRTSSRPRRGRVRKSCAPSPPMGRPRGGTRRRSRARARPRRHRGVSRACQVPARGRRRACRPRPTARRAGQRPTGRRRAPRPRRAGRGRRAAGAGGATARRVLLHERPGDRRGCVGGPVVDQQQLVGRTRLLRERLQQGSEVALLVVERDDHGQCHGVPIGPRGGDRRLPLGRLAGRAHPARSAARRATAARAGPASTASRTGASPSARQTAAGAPASASPPATKPACAARFARPARRARREPRIAIAAPAAFAASSSDCGGTSGSSAAWSRTRSRPRRPAASSGGVQRRTSPPRPASQRSCWLADPRKRRRHRRPHPRLRRELHPRPPPRRGSGGTPGPRRATGRSRDAPEQLAAERHARAEQARREAERRLAERPHPVDQREAAWRSAAAGEAPGFATSYEVLDHRRPRQEPRLDGRRRFGRDAAVGVDHDDGVDLRPFRDAPGERPLEGRALAARRRRALHTVAPARAATAAVRSEQLWAMTIVSTSVAAGGRAHAATRPSLPPRPPRHGRARSRRSAAAPAPASRRRAPGPAAASSPRR